MAPVIAVPSSYHWYDAVGVGVPVTPTADAVSVSPTSGVPVIDADVIDGAAVTVEVSLDVDDAALPTPFVSVTMTVIESPTTALVMT